ncbi:MAG TPA: YkgJ family cysteine cluster protein [Spirochaetales bacterium]|nr:YkgJ family cysteine cluster protein [Spirochaetales bacterium]
MECRPGCGACCEAPSISSPLPGYPHGKPAGVPCPYLSADRRCLLYGQAQRPAVCSSLKPHPDMCGSCRAEAMERLEALELATRP